MRLAASGRLVSLYRISGERMERERAPSWQGKATVLAGVLAAAAFAYLALAYRTQRKFNGLMGDLLSGDAELSRKAADELGSTDAALPHLSNAMLNSRLSEQRLLCADMILRHVHAKRAEARVFAGREEEQRSLRSGLDIRALTEALSDESPAVRAKARRIVEEVGVERHYQRNRLKAMIEYEAVLEKLRTGDETTRASAAEQLRSGAIASLPCLVGVVFSDDDAYRLRGIALLQTIVQDILKGSNQRRVVPLIGRRRCQLLLRELTRLDEKDRPIVLDILNVSGRVGGEFFTSFLERHASAGEKERSALLAATIENLELREKARNVPPAESEKIRKLSGATGDR
jgi:hypothetical protein